MVELCTEVILLNDLRISNIPHFSDDWRPHENVAAYGALKIRPDDKIGANIWAEMFESTVAPSRLPAELRDNFYAVLTGELKEKWMPSEVLINGYGLRTQIISVETQEKYEFSLNARRIPEVKLFISAKNLRDEDITYCYAENLTVSRHDIYLTKHAPGQILRYKVMLEPAPDNVRTRLLIYSLT